MKWNTSFNIYTHSENRFLRNVSLIFWLGSYLEWQKNDWFFCVWEFLTEKRVTFFEFTILTDKQLKRLLEINYPQFTHNALRYHPHEHLTFYLNYNIVSLLDSKHATAFYIASPAFHAFFPLIFVAYGRPSFEYW